MSEESSFFDKVTTPDLEDIKTLNEDSIIDYRFQWLKEKIMNYFNIEDVTAFYRMCDRRGGEYRKKIKEFMLSEYNPTSPASNSQVMFFYATEYERTFYKAVHTKWETEKIIRHEEKKKRKKSVWREEIIKVLNKGAMLVKYKKIVPQLHAIHGKFPLMNGGPYFNEKFIYFIRKPAFAYIPKFDSYQEAYAEMPKYIHVGNFKANTLGAQLQTTMKVISGFMKRHLAEPEFPGFANFDGCSQVKLYTLSSDHGLNQLDSYVPPFNMQPWNICRNGHLSYSRLCIEKNKWPVYCESPIISPIKKIVDRFELPELPEPTLNKNFMLEKVKQFPFGRFIKLLEEVILRNLDEYLILNLFNKLCASLGMGSTGNYYIGTFINDEEIKRLIKLGLQILSRYPSLDSLVRPFVLILQSKLTRHERKALRYELIIESKLYSQNKPKSKRKIRKSKSIQPDDRSSTNEPKHSSVRKDTKPTSFKSVINYCPKKTLLVTCKKTIEENAKNANIENSDNIFAMDFYNHQRQRYSQISELLAAFQLKIKWFQDSIEPKYKPDSSLSRYIKKHKTLGSLLEDSKFMAKVTKFKGCIKYIRHLKIYVNRELPKNKIGIFSLYRHWKKREILIFPFLKEFHSLHTKLLLVAFSLTYPDEAKQFEENLTFLEKEYKKAQLYCNSLKGAISICKCINDCNSLKPLGILIQNFWRFMRNFWVNSVYVNNPEQFFDFMSRVEYILLKKTKKMLEIKHFLSSPPLVAQKTAVQVVTLMRLWRDEFYKYFNLNETECGTLYQSFRASEFKLFINTNNIAKIAYDLFYLAKNLKHFTNIFDRALAYAVKDADKIPDWRKTCIDSTLELSTTNYDIFDFANDKRWDNILHNWYANLQQMENKSILLLYNLFNNIRDSVAATKYITSKKQHETSKLMYRHLSGMLDLCANRFSDEVAEALKEALNSAYDCKNYIYRSQPLPSGLIIWLETLTTYIVSRFKYLITVNSLWKKSELRELKKISYKLIDFYRIMHTMELVAYLPYRAETNLMLLQTIFRNQIKINYEGPTEEAAATEISEGGAISQPILFLNRPSASFEQTSSHQKRNIVVKGKRFEWYEKEAPKMDLGVTKDRLNIDTKTIISPETKSYFSHIKAIKDAKEKRRGTALSNFMKKSYNILSMLSKDETILRINMMYAISENFLLTGKVSTEFMPEGPIEIYKYTKKQGKSQSESHQQNVEMVKSLIAFGDKKEYSHPKQRETRLIDDMRVTQSLKAIRTSGVFKQSHSKMVERFPHLRSIFSTGPKIFDNISTMYIKDCETDYHSTVIPPDSLTGLKRLPYYEAQHFFRKIAQRCLHKFAKYPSANSSSRYLDRLFMSYAAFSVMKVSKNNEIIRSLEFDMPVGVKVSKRDKFTIWKFSYFQAPDKQKFDKIDNLLRAIKNKKLHNFFNSFISKLKNRWDGYTFSSLENGGDLLYNVMRDILYPTTESELLIPHPATVSRRSKVPHKKFIISKNVPCIDTYISGLKRSSELETERRRYTSMASSFTITVPQGEDSFVKNYSFSYQKEKDPVCMFLSGVEKILNDKKNENFIAPFYLSLPDKVFDKKLCGLNTDEKTEYPCDNFDSSSAISGKDMFKETKPTWDSNLELSSSASLSPLGLDNQLQYIRSNSSPRKRCMFSFKVDDRFYELLFNSKHLIESRLLNDNTVRYFCNEYNNFKEAQLALLESVHLYNRFVLQLRKEEHHFLHYYVSDLIVQMFTLIRCYLCFKKPAIKAKKFIDGTIKKVSCSALQFLRDVDNAIQEKYSAIQTYNWFEVPLPSRNWFHVFNSLPLKVFLNSTLKMRKCTQGDLKYTARSIYQRFKVLDYLVFNDFHSQVDSPNFYLYLEKYDIIRILNSKRNLEYNTNQFRKYLFKDSGSSASKPVLELKIKGKNIRYDTTLQAIGENLTVFWIDILRRYQHIPRWKIGTCEEVGTVRISGNFFHRFSIFDELIRLSEAQSSIQDGVQIIMDCLEMLQGYVNRWKIFTKLWAAERKSTVKYIFAHKNFDLKEIYNSLNFLTLNIRNLKETDDYVNVGAFKISVYDVRDLTISRCEKFATMICKQVRSRILNFCRNFKNSLAQIQEIPLHDNFLKYLKALDSINKFKVLYCEFNYGLVFISEVRRILACHGFKLGDNLRRNICNLEKEFAIVGSHFRIRERRAKLWFKAYARCFLSDLHMFRNKSRLFAWNYWFNGPRSRAHDLNVGLDLIKLYKKAFKSIIKERLEIIAIEETMNCRHSIFPLLDAVYRDYKIQKTLYKFYEIFKDNYKIWKNLNWYNFHTKKIEGKLETLISAFRTLNPDVRETPVGVQIRKLMTDISTSLPLFAKLKNKAIKQRHWKQLRKRTDYPYFNHNSTELKLSKFFIWKLYKFSETVDEILELAQNELLIKNKIISISTACKELQLQIVPYYNGTKYRGVALDTNDEVIMAIDDFTLEIQSLSSSPYSAQYLANIQKWEKFLMLVHEVLNDWLSVQRKWKYLESVFVSGDLRNQLPTVAVKFDEVDKSYLAMTSSLLRQRKVLTQCMKPDQLNKFSKLTVVLDECQKALVDYLDTKRNSFPRFYFISNDELLSILATQSPEGIQDQMFKIFDNVCSLKFRPAKSRNIRKRTVSAMVSCENEVLNFHTLRSTNAPIERWMTGIVNEMRKSLQVLTKASILHYAETNITRIDWMFSTLGVIVMAANKTFWTAYVELAFQRFKQRYNKAMKELLDRLKADIDGIVLKVRGKLTKIERKKLNTVLIVDVHSKDIVGKLVSESITKRTCFEWECQLRYYWKSRHCALRIRQCSGFFPYGYEYMGLNGRLVITPLTDRIFLTITQALALKMGGAPAGPAGTGKTETTKDLAKAMGRLCMVTNCGENMDYIQFAKILMGLCQAGAWGCFDEFNRIDISVLSVITTQMQIIRAALMDESVRFFKFEGYKIYMDRKSGVFITMNPGYAGRTELPETLKALFRPVVCIVPDLEHICLIMLFSEGFLTAKILAKKMTLLYSLSKDRLSKQSHYDFGLRSLKPVLTVAGDLKRSSPGFDEEEVIMRALRDMNRPKLVPEDEGLFLELVADLFPGLEVSPMTYESFTETVKEVLISLDYVVIPDQITKVIQLYETMMTRHSSALVGPTRAGKTVIVNTLCEAQTRRNLPTTMVVMNPKAFTVDELYGILDPKTRDWIDGLLSYAFREMNQPIKKPERRYVMFDGDIDALWIENMNSVMDDNKILTLTSGERMRLLDHGALLFEVGDFRYASPATVSRCGIVFVDASILGPEAYWERWLYRRSSPKEITMLSQLYEHLIPSTLDLIFKGYPMQNIKPLSTIIPQNDINVVSQLCCVLESTIPSAKEILEEEKELSFKGSQHKLSDEPKDVVASDISVSKVESEKSQVVDQMSDIRNVFVNRTLFPRTDKNGVRVMSPNYVVPPSTFHDYYSYKLRQMQGAESHSYDKIEFKNRINMGKVVNNQSTSPPLFQITIPQTYLRHTSSDSSIKNLSSASKVSCKKRAKTLKRIRAKNFSVAFNPNPSCSAKEKLVREKSFDRLHALGYVRKNSAWNLLPGVSELYSNLKEHEQECKRWTSLRYNMKALQERLKALGRHNAISDIIRIMRQKYHSDPSCRLGDNFLKEFWKIVQSCQKQKQVLEHGSINDTETKNNIIIIRNSLKTLVNALAKKNVKEKRKSVIQTKLTCRLFKLSGEQSLNIEGIDMFPDNKQFIKWYGSYWIEKIRKLQQWELMLNNKLIEDAQKFMEYSENVSRHFKMMKDSRKKSKNLLRFLTIEESPSSRKYEPKDVDKHSLALRKLSFQYRNIMFKLKSESTGTLRVETKKRLSIVQKVEVATEKEEIVGTTDEDRITEEGEFGTALVKEDKFEDPEIKKEFEKLRAIFVEAMYASLGATLIERDRYTFDAHVKKILNLTPFPDTVEEPSLFQFTPCRMPLLYNYKTDLENNCWTAWQDVLVPYVHDKDKNFDEIFVPTEESSRIGRLLMLMQSIQRPVILTGESGTAKTAIMMEFLRNMSHDCVQLTLTFSSRTTSLDVQRNIEASLEKVSKHALGPPGGKNMIIFIDDLNMPYFDEYGTQQPIALLKQTVEKCGLFDREGDLSWRTLQNVLFLGAMGMTARSDQVVDPRFTSHFSIFNLTPPSDETIRRIYVSILNGHSSGFYCDLMSITSDIMNATLRIYKFIREDIPPSPVRFHYVFSLRDLSRITAGLLQTTPHLFKTKKHFLRAWRNEVLRVFYDRLCLSEDQTRVDEFVSDLLEESFPNMAGFILQNPLLFGDYENFLNPDEPRFYKDLKSYDLIYKIFSDIMDDYNARFTNMDLVLFEDALDHLTRIHRVLRLHRGNLLAIGVGGCGKRSLVTLASYAAECKMYSINLCKGYNENFFKDDLRKLYVMLGVDKTKITFFFTSSHVVQEDFLEYINSILTVGYIPSLFSDEDKDAIINKVRKFARAAGRGRTKNEVWQYFLDSSKNSLHLVLSMSPLGNTLRVRCRSVPSLVNNSTIDWIFPWPPQALNAVANKFIPQELFAPQIKKPVVEHIVFTHLSAASFAEEFLARYGRTAFITPKHYLDFLKMYIKVVEEKNNDNVRRVREYELGLQKMVEAYIAVEIINKETLKQKGVVEEQDKACEILLVELTAATKTTTEKQTIAKLKRKEVEIQSKEIDQNKKEAEDALSVALPALVEAKNALDQLSKKDITEIRSFASPPLPVQTVCECLLILKGYKEINWMTAKGMMADPNFLNNLKTMDPGKITVPQTSRVKKLLAGGTMDKMAIVSKAGFGLLQFVKAMVGYCDVFRIVKPKQEKVLRLEREFAKALEILEKITAEVQKLEKILSDLNNKYATAMAEKRRITEEMEKMIRRLALANKLLGDLSSENERWKKEHAFLKSEQEKIVGNCLITTSFLAYCGAFNSELRREMLQETWKNKILSLKIPFSSRYVLENELMDEMSINRLFAEGLPPDDLSVQNALLVLCSSRFPVCIDPQQQAFRWLIKREKDNLIKVLTFDDSNYLTMLEASIKTGTPVLFKDVEYVDPIIENLIEKNIRGKRGQKVVALGNKDVEYNDKFRLYLVSKLRNPQFESWIYTKSTVINCIVTVNGLEDQLLNVVARNERPDLEEARERLIEDTNLTKESVQFYEKTLLVELATAKGNLLDNIVLIETLESTKTKVSTMQKELQESEENRKGMDIIRNEYRPVARRGALLYFVLYDLASINAMYIYSLEGYLKVFGDALATKTTTIDIRGRVNLLNLILNKKVYDYGCNGLFERDKLIFSFQLAFRLEQALGYVSEEDFRFLIKGDSSFEKCKKSCPAKWLPSERWKDMVKLNSDFPKFSPLLSSFQNNLDNWKEWYDLSAPEKITMPYDKLSELSPFQKLMLFRCLRMDRISQYIPQYVSNIMGPEFVKPPIISIEQVVKTSVPDVPVMFVLCPGANPIPKLIKSAHEFGGLGLDKKILIISLGQGQEGRAEKMFNEGYRRGHWVIFENCHLLPNFIGSIEKAREKKERTPHPEFRFWYATEPTDKFPSTVLQSTTRIVLEVAESFKLNLARIYKGIDETEFKEQVRIHPSFGHIIYVLAFFHAVLLERKKFGQVGFNINYDFSESDFESCFQLIKRYLKKTSHNMRKNWSPDKDRTSYNQYLYDRVPWEILRYLIGEIIYGGRVIDHYDRRTVSTYLEEYMDTFLYQSVSGFNFYTGYPMPLYNHLQLYNRHINNMPDTTFPGVFGLHPNVEIAYNDNKTMQIWKNLTSLQPASASAGKMGAKKEQTVIQIGEKIKKIVPSLYDVQKEKDRYTEYLISIAVSGSELPPRDPTVIILFQELGMFNVLIESLIRSLNNLHKAINGEIVMDTVLENIFDCLYEGEIPTSWRKLIPQTKKSLGEWITHFKKRVIQYNEWLVEFQTSAIWLSGLHVPQSYLTAVMQRTTRLQKWSLDQTALWSYITKMKTSKKVKEIPTLGCYVKDLFIQGARWDCELKALRAPRKKIQVEPIPLLAIRPIKVEERKFMKSFQTPVYTTSNRRNAMGVGFVFEADIQMTSHYSYWVMKGVCLLLNKE